MFHTIITLAYTLPNIYVFFRLMSVFINRKFRLHYIVIYILIALIYPVTETFDISLPGFLSLITDYILPFYLYVFLSVLAFDIFLLINYFSGIVRTDVLKSTRFKAEGLAAVILISMSVVIAGIININRITVSDYNIVIPKKESKISNIKIAFIADFHLKDRTNIGFVRKFTEKIDEIKPDILLLGGDILEGSGMTRNRAEIVSLFKNIKTKYGVYSVLGNHEFHGRQDKITFFDDAGIDLLKDTFRVIDNSIVLLGRYDSRVSTRKTIGEMVFLNKDNLPVIMMDHRPTEIDIASNHNIDLQFSGHTHNGQLFPINYITKQFYILSWGYLKLKNTHFFVTSGIQLWGPPVKTAGVSEIMVVDVELN